MNTRPEQFVAAHKTAVESVLNSLKDVFDTSERLAALNLNTARSAFEDGTAAVRALLEVKDPQAFLNIQAGLAQPVAERAQSWYRNTYEILAQSFEQATKPFEARFAEINKTVAAELEKAALASPVGSEAAVAALKSGIAAANSTFDQVHRATRQAIEIAEANMTAAGNAAVKSVSKEAPKARKSA